MQDPILVEHDGPVATVTFNRPGSRNAISYEMWQMLMDVARGLDADDSVRCVIFRGAGDEAFSAGADIRDFENHRSDSATAARYAEVFEGALEAIEQMSKPTISMIRGFCVGGGLELAAATDIRIAAEGSKFGVPVSRIAIVAGYNELRRMIAVAGSAAVSYLVLSGRIIGHEDALRMGLLTLVTPPDQLEAEVSSLADDIVRGAPISHADHKAMIRRVLGDPGLATLTGEERSLQFRVFDTDDFQEGRAAFLEKRRPEFRGG